MGWNVWWGLDLISKRPGRLHWSLNSDPVGLQVQTILQSQCQRVFAIAPIAEVIHQSNPIGTLPQWFWGQCTWSHR